MPLPKLLSFPLPRLLAALLAAALVLASCGGGDIVKIGIVERFDDPAVDDARDGFLEAMDRAGYKATENVRYFRFNAEGSEFPLDEVVEELVVEEEVDVLLAIGSDALRAAVEGARGQAIFFALATDSTIGGLSDGGFRHGAVTGGAFAPAVGLVEMVSPGPAKPRPHRKLAARRPRRAGRARLRRRGAPREPKASAAPDSKSWRSKSPTPPRSPTPCARAAEAGVAAIALTPSALLDDALEDILAAAATPGRPRRGDAPRPRRVRGAYAARGSVDRREWPDRRRNAGPLPRRRGPQQRAGQHSIRRSGLWLSRPAADALKHVPLGPARLRRRGRGDRVG